MKKRAIILIALLAGLFIYGEGKDSAVNCDSKVADTKSVIDADIVLLQSLLKEVADRQKELSQLQLKRDKIKEKMETAKTVAEWLELDKEKICGPTVVIPDPYLCTLKRYYDPAKKAGFIVDQLSRCKKGLENGCGNIFTLLQIQPHISKIAWGSSSGGSSLPPISISLTVPIGSTVIGSGIK